MDWKRLNPVLWKYPDTTSAEDLLRHYRFVRRIGRLTAFSATAFASSLAQGMAMGWATTAITLTLAFGALAVVLMVPYAISLVWAGDIERALQAEGRPLPPGQRLSERPPYWVFKMMFWFALAVALPWLVRWVETVL